MVDPASRTATAGHGLRRIVPDRSDETGIIDPMMLEERLVLGRDEGLDEHRRIFVISELDATFAGESLDRIAVISANVGRKRRLISEQFLDEGRPVAK
jgi:hypothetical protein